MQVAWTVGPIEVQAFEEPIPVMVPADAWMSPLQGTYVTDLVAFVTIDGSAEVAEPGFLAWPSGENDPPVVWNTTQMRVEAPQGVLDETLRMPNIGSSDRIMPPVEWPRADAFRRPEENDQ
jgi:hypothetical protein